MENLKIFLNWLLSFFKPVQPSEVKLIPVIESHVEMHTVLVPGCRGIDISHHNMSVDFNLVKESFIFLKATEGANFVSSTYNQRIAIAMSKNIPCGAYHYFKPGTNPVKQAQHFCKYIRGILPPVLDIEELNGMSKGKLKEDLQTFLDEVEKETGKVCIIYSGHSFIVELNLPESFAKYPLWLARYTKIIPKAPAPWKEWTFWQYSESEIVPGVGKCDVNIYKMAAK